MSRRRTARRWLPLSLLFAAVLLFAVGCKPPVQTSTPAGLPSSSADLERGTPDPSRPFHGGLLRRPFGKPRQVTYQIVRGRALFQGDIDLGPVDAKGDLLPRPGRPPIQTAVGVVDTDLLWPGCVVPWQFGSAPGSLQTTIQVAVNTWQAALPSCSFPFRTSEADYLVFNVNTDANGGSHSSLGRIGGGQEVSINQTVTNPFIVVHEIGHALGLDHEHNRYDRDRFVTVVWANLRGDCKHDFEIDKSTVDVGLYNYNSFMHYPPNACSEPKGVTTLIPKMPAAIGQRTFMDSGDVSGVLEIQAQWRGWTVFQPQGSAVAAAASAPALGPYQEEIYYQSRMSGGRDFGMLCRRHNFGAPLPPDCMTSLPPEPLAGIPASSPTPGVKGESAIFVLGRDTSSYLHFRRDYLTDRAGGAFRLEPAPAGSNWLSSPAALTLGQRILVFGVRGRVDHPGETAIHLIIKDYGDGTNPHPWSTPIELPLPAGSAPSFEPAVVSTRSGSWTLFTFDLKSGLWATEGNPDGTITTPWTRISDFAGGGLLSGPAVTITQVRGEDFLVLAAGPDGHLFYSGVGKGLKPTDPWRDVGGLLTGRPAAATYSSGTLVGVVANVQDQPFWFREWDPLSHVVKGGF